MRTYSYKNCNGNHPVSSECSKHIYTIQDMWEIGCTKLSPWRPTVLTMFANADSEGLLFAFAERFLISEQMEVAVCGLHKQGFPLEYQLTSLGATFVEHTRTAAKYDLYRLATEPVKPGLVKCSGNEKGTEIVVDVYQMNRTAFGQFMEMVSSPLVMGDVELVNGKVVKGFLCEPCGLLGAEKVSEVGEFLE